MLRTNNIDLSKYTPFQQRVFRTILKIPKGRTWTYGQAAARLGNKNLARAVGNALGKNRNAPQVPCHRVVGKSSIGGYSAPGGVKRKMALLKQEGYRAR